MDHGRDSVDHGGCQELAEVACELALGILTGPKRARALNHLEACGRCRRLVAELTKASDAVIAFAPQAEPPAGFETRVLDRMAMSGVERTADLSMMGDLSIGQERRLGRGVLMGLRGPFRLKAAAVVAALVLLTGTGLWALSRSDSGPVSRSAVAVPHSQGTLLASPLLSPSSRSLGVVLVDPAKPTWVFMSVNDAGVGKGPIQCHLEFSTGRDVLVGEFNLYEGRGDWGAPVPAGLGQVVEARLVQPGGSTLATAHFA